ncbi:macro domain-containing protein [Anaerostipes hominis (ex Liu et al. 2021)]|uniref:Macro domain-containing protein n=1 Tax=Anaerostipes hominis (ex Liu et al. 2021) TaxID=2763018 RepID=A0ABR7FT18_9FIRM|nr:macro domain-containing protein [Anaerostipes hominis (ex Liu et al. 2021)]
MESCYLSCLKLTEEKKLDSIVFCCISTGEYHFPNRKAAEIALNTVLAYLDKGSGLKRIVFNVFKDIDWEIYKSGFTA